MKIHLHNINIYRSRPVLSKGLQLAFAMVILFCLPLKTKAQSCANPVNAPVTLNGINVSGSGTGFTIFPSSFTSCVNATTPNNALLLGSSGAFSYTYTFSQPVNNVVIVIAATGQTFDEFFTINTNGGGLPNITSGNMCYTVISGNQIASGLGSPAGPNGGGGGLFNIYNPGGNYTTLTISGAGGEGGSLFALCGLSIGGACPLAWNNISSAGLTCNGIPTGSITADAINGAGPLSYNLQPGNVTNQTGMFSGLAAGVYTVSAIDANCSITTTVSVSQPTAISITSAGSTPPSCMPGCDGTLTTSTTGGSPAYTYSISGGGSIDAAGVASGLCLATIYTVTANDATGCSGSATFQLLSQNAPAISIINKSDESCPGICDGSLNVNGSGGVSPYNYSIAPVATQGSPGSFSNMCAGNYTVTITDASGCMQTTSVTIGSAPSLMNFTTVNIHEVYCNGDSTGSIAVVVSGASGIPVFSIAPAATQFPAGFFKDLQADTYTLTATDANGCNVTTLATVNEKPALLFHSVTLDHPVCSYDSTGVIQYTASGGTAPLIYSLNDGLPHLLNAFDSLKSGIYKLKVIDDLGCSKDTFVTLTAATPVSAMITVTDALCVDSANGRADISGTGGYGSYRYFVTPGLQINKTGAFYNLSPSTYTLRVVDTMGCEYKTSFRVEQPANPLSNSISKLDLACYGRGNEGKATANTWGGTPPYVYQWSTTPVQNTALAEGLYTGYYYLNIADASGCQITDTVYIEEGPCCDVAFIPNAFTPNGDNLNDQFVIFTTAGVEMIQFEIFDRWGQRIFVSSDWRRGWDGMIDGKEAAVATYFYVYRYKCSRDGKNYIKKGDVMLIR